MIDKTTFVICLVKLLGLQIILFGVFFSILHNAPIYQILICLGSLVFAVGSNVLLAVSIKAFHKLKNGGDENGKYKSKHNCQDFIGAD
jgi:hypothetical protein